MFLKVTLKNEKLKQSKTLKNEKLKQSKTLKDKKLILKM